MYYGTKFSEFFSGAKLVAHDAVAEAASKLGRQDAEIARLKSEMQAFEAARGAGGGANGDANGGRGIQSQRTSDVAQAIGEADKFSKVLSILPLYSKCTTPLTFQNVRRPRSRPFCSMTLSIGNGLLDLKVLYVVSIV
jgi:hypothetical protein